MIESVTIFTKGGIVLYTYTFLSSLTDFRQNGLHNKDPIDHVIKTIFLEERTTSSFSIGQTQLKWVFVNTLDVIIVAMFDGTTRAATVDKFLELICQDLKSVLPNHLVGPGHRDMTLVQTELLDIFQKTPDFKKRLMNLLDKCDSHNERRINPKTNDAPPILADVKNKKDAQMWKQNKRTGEKKAPTTWGTQKVTRQAMIALDLSKEDNNNNSDVTSEESNRYGGENSFSEQDEEEEEQEEEEEEKEQKTPVKPSTFGFFSKIQSAIQDITGNKVLTEADLEPILQEFRSVLMSKNVAPDVAMQLANSIKMSLIDTKTESFTSVKTVMKKALSNAIQRVLTQTRSVDVLNDAKAAKEKGRIYSICFLGVNGVGKSTNLAKVAYYLKHKGHLNVLIAACDTFRAGAVEQLRTHARNLNVQLFEQGYGKDAALICRNAMKYAQSEGYDVVLIDTAGRMQDNEPLMRALAKLVAVNNPDLVLFVGEALVGNDAIDQLTKFNRSLIDFAPPNVEFPRGIDGIVLTKFDTVDDKVGAALSMAYISGQPVVFVGTGQKYTHLQMLNVNTVLNALLGAS